jgi:hypothetical protein
LEKVPRGEKCARWITLTEQFEEALEALGARSIQTLLIDISGNGGGNNWVDEVATRISSAPAPCTRVAIIRHPHHERQIEDELHKLEADLRKAQDEAERSRLHAREKHLGQLLAEVRKPCDRTPLWRGERLTCSGLVEATDAAEVCTHEQSKTAPKVALPLLLLVDRRTASASEYLAVRLKDHARAVVIGEHTSGAGCGMTNGGVPISLPRAGLRVELPDCARLRYDGRNEREGVEVDIALGPHSDSGWSPEVILRALSAVDGRAAAPSPRTPARGD